MTRGIGHYPCDRCRKVFGGQFGYDLHFEVIPGTDGETRCKGARELRRIGFEQRASGEWIRPRRRGEPRQGRLFRQGRPWRRKAREQAARAKGAVSRGAA